MIRSMFFLFAALQIFTVANIASAQVDTVFVTPPNATGSDSTWYPRPIKHLSGKVVSLDNKALKFIVSGDQVPTQMAAYRLVWIRPGSVSAEQSAALKLFADEDYSAAVTPLIESVSQRPPVWRQQMLLMLAANAAWRSRRSKVSLELVAQLDARPLPPCTIAWLPIAWRGQRPQVATIDAAETRITDDSPTVRLVAASWLLSSPSRQKAAQVLKQLAVANDRPVIARLAESVLWASATPPEVIKKHREWEKKVDAMPLAIQTGPRLLLATKSESAGLTTFAKKQRLALELTPAIPYPLK